MVRFLKLSLMAACLMAAVLVMFRLAVIFPGRMVGKTRLYSFLYDGNMFEIKRDVVRGTTDVKVVSELTNSKQSEEKTTETRTELGKDAKTTRKPTTNSKIVEATRAKVTTAKPNTKAPPVTTKPKTTTSLLTQRKEPTQQQVVSENNAKKGDLATTAISLSGRTTRSPSTTDICPIKGPTLVGPLAVDQTIPGSFEKIVDGWDKKYMVNKGGAWKPTTCQAANKAAIIIPYRAREEQLKIFVRHMHPMLQRQLLDYRIMVIEQDGDTPFNRALLFNIGYKESLKFNDFNCFVFHDVDLIPENDHNYYGCPTSPRHLSVAIDKFHYRLPYANIFGGAGSLTKEHFEKINGFSNTFWGWGGEDDDLFKRIRSKDLKLTRPSMAEGRYKMVRIHHKSAKANPKRFEKLRSSTHRMQNDGLNSLKYHVKAVLEEPLYTKVTVEVNPNELQK